MAAKTKDTPVDDNTDDSYTEDTDDNYTEDTPTVDGFNPGQPTAKLSTGIPPRVRRTSNYELWNDTIETLRTTDLGQTYGYDNVTNVGGIAQGLRKHFGVKAAIRDVISARMVGHNGVTVDDVGKGSLYVEYPAYLGEDGKTYPDEDAVQNIKDKAK